MPTGNIAQKFNCGQLFRAANWSVVVVLAAESEWFNFKKKNKKKTELIFFFPDQLTWLACALSLHGMA